MNCIRNTTVISSFAAVILFAGCSGSEESAQALPDNAKAAAEATAELADAAGDQALPPVSSGDDRETEGD